MIQVIIALVVSITVMIILMRALDVHPFFALLIAGLLYGLVAGKDFLEIIAVMQGGFGQLLIQIGFIVALGSCLGVVMEKSGAMETISTRIVSLFGHRRSVLAMTTIGLIVGIPVFCDSAFIILSRLIPSVASQASVGQAPVALALSSGLYATHVLVPPTPGPLTAAVTYGQAEHLGVVMLVSFAVSLPVGLVSYMLSKRIGAGILIEQQAQPVALSHSGQSLLPALLPIAVPIILIAIVPLARFVEFTSEMKTILNIMGTPVVALSIGLCLGLIELVRKRSLVPGKLKDWIADALKDAGIILLITGAGGSFGAVIRSSEIDSLLSEQFGGIQTGGATILILAYVIAAILKTAQGSSTSSMIITSSLLAPITANAGFVDAVHYATLVIATGAGAMTISHANDSYFWVISQFARIPAREAFRSFTVITFFQGLTALAFAILIFLLS